MTPRTQSPRTGSTRPEFPTQKLPSLKTGTRTLHLRSSTRKPLSPTIGSRMSLIWSQIQRPRSQKIGMMRKTVTGSHQWYQIPNVRKSPAAVNGSHLRRRTLPIRANGLLSTLITQHTRVCGHQRKYPTLITLRTRRPPNSNPWAL